jgi:hypothetical protein
MAAALPSDADALATLPAVSRAPAQPSEFLAALHAYANRSAQALQLFGVEGT